MTAEEFKAWLAVYEVRFANSVPSPSQWAHIKAKLSTVGAPAPTYKPVPPLEPDNPLYQRLIFD